MNINRIEAWGESHVEAVLSLENATSVPRLYIDPPLPIVSGQDKLNPVLAILFIDSRILGAEIRGTLDVFNVLERVVSHYYSKKKE